MDDQKPAKQPSKGERLAAATSIMARLSEMPPQPHRPAKERPKG
jgi:hypothetical protein